MSKTTIGIKTSIDALLELSSSNVDAMLSCLPIKSLSTKLANKNVFAVRSALENKGAVSNAILREQVFRQQFRSFGRVITFIGVLSLVFAGLAFLYFNI